MVGLKYLQMVQWDISVNSLGYLQEQSMKDVDDLVNFTNDPLGCGKSFKIYTKAFSFSLKYSGTGQVWGNLESQ